MKLKTTAPSSGSEEKKKNHVTRPMLSVKEDGE